jgi:hypothetical protein
MTRDDHDLVERVRAELVHLDMEVDNVRHAWARAHLAAESDEMLIRATALSLHAFYSGLERLFEQIARRVDGRLPAGEAWHRDLLFQMASELERVRPAVLNEEEARQLQAYLAFRHVVRNIYTENLIPQRVRDLVDLLPGLWAQVRRQLEALANYLSGV